MLWLLEELSLPYEIVRYDRDPRTLQAPSELKALHPLGKSPVLTENGQVFAETGAIFEYILGVHGSGRLVPSYASPAYWKYIYWLHYAEGSAMPLLSMKLVFQRIAARAPTLLRVILGVVSNRTQSSFIDPELRTHVDYWESELVQSTWFAGPEFTAADIMMSYPIQAAAARAAALKGHPRLADYVAKIEGRTPFRRAIEKGGVFAAL